MNPTFFEDMLNDLRFSFASLLAIWGSLLVPMALMALGVFALGGGLRGLGAVVFAAAIFSAADWLYLIVRFARDMDNDDDRIDGLLERPVLAIARVLSQRYL